MTKFVVLNISQNHKKRNNRLHRREQGALRRH